MRMRAEREDARAMLWRMRGALCRAFFALIIDACFACFVIIIVTRLIIDADDYYYFAWCWCYFDIISSPLLPSFDFSLLYFLCFSIFNIIYDADADDAFITLLLFYYYIISLLIIFIINIISSHISLVSLLLHYFLSHISIIFTLLLLDIFILFSLMLRHIFFWLRHFLHYLFLFRH